MDFDGTAVDEIEGAGDRIREILMGWISGFITDEHRSFIVRCHARGFSTSEAISVLIREDRTMNRLAEKDGIGEKELHRRLLARLKASPQMLGMATAIPSRCGQTQDLNMWAGTRPAPTIIWWGLMGIHDLIW